jgi:hypothetical protein
MPDRLDAISDHLLAQGLMGLSHPPRRAHRHDRAAPERAHTARHVMEIMAGLAREGYVHVDLTRR